ncbi:MAG TPA: peptidylprolyl isomerase [Ilumatobacter sp.]|nr:peptidylprolyl isomerase [Ilumatobacter sp.]
MGTAKRERQKANRALRRVEEQQEARKDTVKRNFVKWGAVIVAAFAAVVLIAWVGGAFDGDDDNAGTITDAFDDDTTDAITDQTVAPITEPDVAVTEPASTTPAAAAECPAADGSSEQQREFAEPQPMCIDPTKTYTAEIVTSEGTLVVDLLADQAPATVNNFVTLARYHYFDGISCHRIISGFMAQCGDPTGTGTGGPGYRFDDELPTGDNPYATGVLAMANSGPNTNGSQFFVMLADYPLQPSYSVFGQVTQGLDDTIPALDAAADPSASNGVPTAKPVTIESVTITES